MNTSKEEIIKQLEDLRSHCIDMANTKGASPIWAKDIEALGMAIEALEQEPCEDAISRILEQIDKSYAYFENGDIRYGFDICKDIIDRELKKMPSVQPNILAQHNREEV